MKKFALIGKNIQHSKSPEMYLKHLQVEHYYELLDYVDSSQIPTAHDLFSTYCGINITSPYKKHFLAEVSLDAYAQESQAINCLGVQGDSINGTNTDFSAIEEILGKVDKAFTYVTLGSGVMANLTTIILQKLGCDFFQLSRSQGDSLDSFDFVEWCRQKKINNLYIINACSREFVFRGTLPEGSVFWDYNYAYGPHSYLYDNKSIHYRDGIDLLELQAKHAIQFWNIVPE